MLTTLQPKPGISIHTLIQYITNMLIKVRISIKKHIRCGTNKHYMVANLNKEEALKLSKIMEERAIAIFSGRAKMIFDDATMKTPHKPVGSWFSTKYEKTIDTENNIITISKDKQKLIIDYNNKTVIYKVESKQVGHVKYVKEKIHFHITPFSGSLGYKSFHSRLSTLWGFYEGYKKLSSTVSKGKIAA